MALSIKSFIWMYFLLSAIGRGRMTRPEARSSVQYGLQGKMSVLTGLEGVDRLVLSKAFMFASLGRLMRSSSPVFRPGTSVKPGFLPAFLLSLFLRPLSNPCYFSLFCITSICTVQPFLVSLELLSSRLSI